VKEESDWENVVFEYFKIPRKTCLSVTAQCEVNHYHHSSRVQRKPTGTGACRD